MFLNKDNSLQELSDSYRKIVGVSPSSSGSFPFLYYENDFSDINIVTNTREVEFTYFSDTNTSCIEKNIKRN